MCTGAHGFYGDWTDRIKLDTTNVCGAALNGDPEVNGVNGVNLMTSPAEAYILIRDVCARGGDLAFDQPGGGHLAPVQCHATIPELPQVFEITALPALPQP